jgi:hypothetical protein
MKSLSRTSAEPGVSTTATGTGGASTTGTGTGGTTTAGTGDGTGAAFGAGVAFGAAVNSLLRSRSVRVTRSNGLPGFVFNVAILAPRFVL